MPNPIGALLNRWSDLFGRQTTNITTDLIDVPGEHDFSPERLRYYKDGTRRFLEYGDDANYSETAAGHLLKPDADQILTLTTAERATYPVAADLLGSGAYRLTQAPQPGDAAGWGYGVMDLANFDPATRTWSGTDADGYFAIHTADTGLEDLYLIGVRNGTVWDEYRTTRSVAADILTILETELNCYGVGAAVTTETYTDKAESPQLPQQNNHIGAIANDDGLAASVFSHRIRFSVSQAAGNTGLGMEAGSVSVRASNEPNYQFKNKGHSMDLEYTNPTETYQVLGAIRADPARPTVKFEVPEFNIIKTPGNAVSRTRVLFVAVDMSETNAPADEEWSTPVEHNPANSVVEEVEVAGDATTPLTGPVQDAAGTDVTGPDTANSMNNPGGYQVGRDSITPEGANSPPALGSAVGNRVLYDTDILLILADSSTAGTIEIDVTTEQNS